MSANKRLTVLSEIRGTIVRLTTSSAISSALQWRFGTSTGFGVLARYGNDLGELFGAESSWGARARGIL